MSEGKTPTIEQKSTFASKTKEGSDVEFVATIKFYINPTGDVRIETPGSKQSELRSVDGAPTVTGDTTAPTVAGDVTHARIKEEKLEKKETKPSEAPAGVTGTDGPKPTKETPHKDITLNDKPKKFQSNKEIDKQFPRIQGDCAISNLIPDTCKALDDLTKSIKRFFSGSSGKQPPSSDVSNIGHTPKPRQLAAGELEHTENKNEDEMMDKEEKYEV